MGWNSETLECQKEIISWVAHVNLSYYSPPIIPTLYGSVYVDKVMIQHWQF